MRVLAVVVVFLVLAEAAAGDGGPVPAVQGGTGAYVGEVGYVAVGLRHRTVIERIRRADASVETWRWLRGSWGVPGIGYGGSTTGLSGDGKVLVLARITNRYPVRRSGFALFDPRRMRVVSRFALPGYYTVDAISPHGRWLYLTHYTSRRDPYEYEVRAFDLVRERLLPEPLVDRREPDEEMGGLALTRVSSPGSRWAYTLYQRPTGEAFVHALDTVGRRAFCVDLDDVAIADSLEVDMQLAGHVLRVEDQALIDTRTFTVSPPGLPLISQAALATHPAAV